MVTLRPNYPLATLCRVLAVSRSGYYAWRTRRPSPRAQENARLEVAIQAAHVCTRWMYGPERLQAELRDDGLPAGIGRIKRLRKRPGLLYHSDRGAQYCAHTYQAQLRHMGLRVSMSRRGNCYDNAPMESFWGTLKNEFVHHRRYETREQARQEIMEYIEIFYNRQRQHSRLGNRSPATFAQQCARQQPAA